MSEDRKRVTRPPQHIPHFDMHFDNGPTTSWIKVDGKEWKGVRAMGVEQSVHGTPVLKLEISMYDATVTGDIDRTPLYISVQDSRGVNQDEHRSGDSEVQAGGSTSNSEHPERATNDVTDSERP